jgi:hypothetical protein
VQTLIWRIYHANTYVTYWRRFRAFPAFAAQHLAGEALKAVRKFEQKRADQVEYYHQIR